MVLALRSRLQIVLLCLAATIAAVPAVAVAITIPATPAADEPIPGATGTDGQPVRAGRAAPEQGSPQSQLSPTCLRGGIATGWSLVNYEGGNFAGLDACLQGRGIAHVYTLHDDAWVAYVAGGPPVVNAGFESLFPDGLSGPTPLLAYREGSAAPSPTILPGQATQPGCIVGDRSGRFNIVVYEGGSVIQLGVCGRGIGLEYLFALIDGTSWIAYQLDLTIPNARHAFEEEFPDGVPVSTTLVGFSFTQ